MSLDPARGRAAYLTARDALLAERAAAGHWVGELSTSALSTAVAIAALSVYDDKAGADHSPLIDGGLRWLAANVNEDGAWGDTVKSFSNVSTTMLVRAAFHLCDASDAHGELLSRSAKWLSAKGYGDTPEQHAESIRRRYGKDRTFSVPILMTSALAGLVSWREVPSLPFELACLPQSWYRFARLPVVSYALPALIAIGQAVFHHRGTWNPLALVARKASIGPSLRVLSAIQPPNGGFLEATPLTAFVCLALSSCDRATQPAVTKCVEFLRASVLPDGSWPIDTNLATWVTTLSVNALAEADDLRALSSIPDVRSFLLRQQYRTRHPFTGADPGAWAWTDLPGGVPDADDTPGALLALRNLDAAEGVTVATMPAHVAAAIGWLLDLQNGDGGWPTFCRGWGVLPFDRSGTDLTAHAMRAIHAWKGVVGRGTRAVNADRIDSAIERGFSYLKRQQHREGYWLPLWFGNQHAPDDINPTYGTAKVLAAYRDLGRLDDDAAVAAVGWLLRNRNDDGGWGGCLDAPSSVEETGLATEVLHAWRPRADEAVARGVQWLVERVEAGTWRTPSPIGFYFAKLWYFERMYPLVYAAQALGRAARE